MLIYSIIINRVAPPYGVVISVIFRKALSGAFFLYTENHSLGEWFKKAYGGK